jgi:hypothetical protein
MMDKVQIIDRSKTSIKFGTAGQHQKLLEECNFLEAQMELYQINLKGSY